MPTANVRDMNGQVVGTVELSEEIFGAPINTALLHQVVRVQLANKRQGTKSSLTRSEVRGGGKKPWRQKGTGRARQGSTRSPQWRHGGVVFAPKPRDFSMTIPRKMRRAAIRCALSSKVVDGSFIVLDKLALEAPKTKLMATVLKALEVSRTALCVIPEKDESLLRAASNIPGLKLAYTNTINTYDILKHQTLIIVSDALKQVEEVYAS